MKEQKSIMVLRRMTQSDVENLGGSMMLRKRWKYWIAMLVLSLIWAGLITQFLKGNEIISSIIAILPLVLVFISFYYTSNKWGKKLWNSIKDKEQPVRL